jgi:long-chain acyl-CoA synthetase
MEPTNADRRTAHLACLPDQRAALDPEGACIDDDLSALTNAQFASRVHAAAAALDARGVRAGDVLATLLPNRIGLVVAMFAAWRLGAAVTPVDPSLTTRAATLQVKASGSRLVLHEATDLRVPHVEAVDVSGPPSEAVGGGLPTNTDRDALALVIYTSGTTGKPKGVMLDHANLAAMVDMIGTAVGLTSADRCLSILPLSHVNGIVGGVLSSLAAGGSTSITGRFAPVTFFDTVEAVRPTYFCAVPSMFAALSALPDDVRPATSSLRFAVASSAPLPPEPILRFEERYGVPIIEAYGLSEATCASTINPVDGPRKPGTVGLPVPGQDVSLIGWDGRRVAEGLGEVVIRGPNVMRGYLDRPQATAEALAGGWLHTGDVGHFDEDGYLVLVDRVEDMITNGTESISPREIEGILLGHPGVLEAAVVGRAHRVAGEQAVAFVALRSPAAVTPDELLEWCTVSLAAFKVPREIVILDALPKDASGRPAKPVLRDLVASISTAASSA